MASDHEDDDDDLYGSTETKPAQQSHTKEEQDASSGDEPMDEGADSGDDDDDEDDDSESVRYSIYRSEYSKIDHVTGPRDHYRQASDYTSTNNVRSILRTTYSTHLLTNAAASKLHKNPKP